MKEFFATFQKSIYDPVFYRELLGKPFSYSAKYYLAFALFTSVLLTVFTSIPLIAGANRAVREFPEKFFAYIPDELEVTVTKGIVSTNVVEPYYLPIPSGLSDAFIKSDVQNIMVIDTQQPFSLEQFKSYRSLIWLSRDQFIYHDDKGGLRLQPIDPAVSMVVNEAKLRGFEKILSGYYRYIGPIIAILIFLAMVIVYLVNFLYLFFGALVIWVLLHGMLVRVPYMKAYQIGLHAITLPIVAQFILSVSGLPIPRIPFLPTIIMLAIVYFNYKDHEAIPTSTTSPVTPPVPTEHTGTPL